MSGERSFHDEGMLVADPRSCVEGIVTNGTAEVAGKWGVDASFVGLCTVYFCLGETSSSSSPSDKSSSLSSLIDAGMSPFSGRDLSTVGLVGLACLPFFDPEVLEGNSHCRLPFRHP